MIKALLEHGVKPDVVIGTSVGALNGAAVAADASLSMVNQLREIWLGLDQSQIFGSSMFAGAAHLVRGRTHMHTNKALKDLIERLLPVKTFEELPTPFHCVAACIERASEHWFDSGPLAPAILASSAIPGVLPAVEINGEHFVDGGIVNSIPISRAVELGAKEIFVLHVGRIEQPLTPPRTSLQVAFVAFEIARRHRFATDLAKLPKGVVAHVLPTGQPSMKPSQLKQLNYRNFKAVARRIDSAHKASAAYLSSLASAK